MCPLSSNGVVLYKAIMQQLNTLAEKPKASQLTLIY